MDVTVYQAVEWDREITIRDNPYGDNSVGLKPLQLDVLLQEDFLMGGGTARLPQPDATFSAVVVTYHPGHSWHFRQTSRELIIPEADWPDVRQHILALYSTVQNA